VLNGNETAPSWHPRGDFQMSSTWLPPNCHSNLFLNFFLLKKLKIIAMKLAATWLRYDCHQKKYCHQLPLAWRRQPQGRHMTDIATLCRSGSSLKKTSAAVIKSKQRQQAQELWLKINKAQMFHAAGHFSHVHNKNANLSLP
jgi:hypothetical protein